MPNVSLRVSLTIHFFVFISRNVYVFHGHINYSDSESPRERAFRY